MVTYRFRRYLPTLNGTQVTFSLPLEAEWETISIAADWKDGLKKSQNGEVFNDTGYIGAGSAKRVVYVFSLSSSDFLFVLINPL
jgi:hypothetical protein